jgi:DNA mismatch repair protein MutS
MSGIPWHTCDLHIDRLVAKGYKVAIAEQMEDPKTTKGLLKREIVRFITPGTLINSSLVEEKEYNFIAAFSQVGALLGIAFCDITTSVLHVLEVESREDLLNELHLLHPAELVLSKKSQDKHPLLTQICVDTHTTLSLFDEWHFEHQTASQYLTQHFHVSHLDAFGLKGMVAAINAAGALLAYIHEELSLSIDHIRTMKPYSTKEVLLLDRTCRLNLELTEPIQGRGRHTTLLHLIDHTYTPMGGRLIRQWLHKPLLDVREIHRRQDAVEALFPTVAETSPLAQELASVRDIERLMMKISSGFATPRDLSSFRFSLTRVKPIKEYIQTFPPPLLAQCSEKLGDFSSLLSLLEGALVDDPPSRVTEGGFIREGYHPPLDTLRRIAHGGKEWLVGYQTTIKEQTGIKTLKVHFNKIFGYYIEVSKGQAHLMPQSFERRQTLVHAERFISPELKEYESKVLVAEEESQLLEQTLFVEICTQSAAYEKEIIATAQALAEIDTLLSLAQTAHKGKYIRPIVDNSQKIYINEGRHPVVEMAIEREKFIPNDTHLDTHSERMMMITGPNMAGKSTYIRQVSLLVILAQIGSFVPARTAHIGVVDRIFARIGAHDDLSRGQSTFMVEMSETANILHNATSRSLVILDEIGRGTSTYDGVSIAWAVAEQLLSLQAKTLFATHYWELTELEKAAEGCINYHAAVQEWKDTIVFQHKILLGSADRSYGIHVARLAGLPLPVIQRAGDILKKLEARKDPGRRTKKESQEIQLMLF